MVVLYVDTRDFYRKSDYWLLSVIPLIQMNYIITKAVSGDKTLMEAMR